MLLLSRLCASMEMPRLMGSRIEAISFTHGNTCWRAGRWTGQHRKRNRGDSGNCVGWRTCIMWCVCVRQPAGVRPAVGRLVLEGSAHLPQPLGDAWALPPIVRRPLKHRSVRIVPQNSVDVQRLQAGIGRQS